MSRSKDKKLINVLIVTLVLVAILVVFVNFMIKNKEDYVYITFLCPIDGSTTVVKSVNNYVVNEQIEHKEIDGYEFLGWFYDNDYKRQVEIGAVFSDSRTIKACYSKVLTKTEQPLEQQISQNSSVKHFTIKSQNENCLTKQELTSLSKLNPEYLDLKNCLYESNELERGLFNSYLKTLYLPSNITKINDNCFNGLMYESNQPDNIEFGAFGLKQIYLNENLLAIGNKAFYGCSELESLKCNTNLIQIGQRAFEKTGITQIYLNKNLLNVKSCAFKGLNIKEIEIDNQNANLKLENNILYTSDYKELLLSFNYKNQELTINQQTEVIQPYAFENNNNLKTVNFGSLIKTIGEYSFYNCKNITDLKFSPTVELTVNNSAFAGLESLKNVELPVGLIKLDNSAFENCISLNSVVFNILEGSTANKIQHIGQSCFAGCKNLLTFVVPSSVTNLGMKCFENCYNLQNITLSPLVKNIEYKTFYNNYNLVSIISNTSIDNIGDYAFAECEKLHNIDCLLSTKTIGVLAFQNCKDLNIANFNNVEKLSDRCFEGCEKLEFTSFSSLKQIENQVFKDCLSLKEFNFLNQIENFNNDIFEGCDNLEKITMVDNENYVCMNNVVYSKDLKSLLYYPLNKQETIFNIDQNLQNIESKNVFINQYISQFVVDPDNLYFSENDGNLYNKTGTKLIKYGNGKTKERLDLLVQVETIGKYALQYNKVLKQVIFPKSLIEIELGALKGMEKLNILEIPFIGQSKTSNRFIGYIFGSETFISNGNFLPETLKTVKITEENIVPEYSFYNTKNIEKIEFNKEVGIVEKFAFYNSFNLKNVKFNGKISKICEFALFDLYNLKYITIGFDRDVILEYNCFGKIKNFLIITVHNNNQIVPGLLAKEYEKKFKNIYSQLDVDFPK